LAHQFDHEEHISVTLEDGLDRWPMFALTPAEYERAVADLVRTAGHEVTDWQVQHLEPVEGVDGTFVIDVTVRFRLLGADFLMLFECKRHASPVKREDSTANRAIRGVRETAHGKQRI
jgi:hypothetical protein